MPTEAKLWTSEAPAGSTPLDPSDLHELKLSWVTTLEDLNGAEQACIARALMQPKWQVTPVSHARAAADLLLEFDRSQATHRFGSVTRQ